MPIVQLIYVSTATHQLEEDEIRKILESSVRRNTPQEVTGLLLYAYGSFMQVLEGGRAAVDETMSRIVADTRHHSIYVLSDRRVPTRDFGHWSMAFRGVTAHDAATWPGYAPLFEHGFSAEVIGARPGLALKMLQKFASNNG